MILGSIGMGKTALLNWFAHYYESDGYRLFLNYKSKSLKYVNLDAVDKILDVKSEKNFIGGDEWYRNMDSRRTQNQDNIDVCNEMLQSRKKRFEIYATGQYSMLFDPRLRMIISEVYYPKILLKDPNGKPLLISAEIYDYQKALVYKYQKPKRMLFPMEFDFGKGLVDVCEDYNTYEIIDKMKPKFEKKFKELTKKYKDFSGSKGQLKSILELDEKLAPIRADKVANYITGIRKKDKP